MDSENKIIFLVDDNPTNLMAGREMLKEQYNVYPIPSAKIMFNLLENVVPNMILLDIEMPEMNGYEAIKRLKDDAELRDIPVMFLTARVDRDSELEGLSLGAIDYVFKPFSAPLLLKRIENHLLSESRKTELKIINDNLEEIVEKRTAQVVKLQSSILNTVANLVEYRDDATGGHVARTQKYLQILVDKLIETGLYADEVALWDMEYLILSAQLHDVGKIAISDLILNKQGKLTYEEFEIMKTHAEIGVGIIRQIEKNADEHNFTKHAALIAGGHHEKWDGSGYPAGIKGSEIPLEARLMAIADVYDALVSVRPYKKALSTEEAKQIIEDGKGTHFDPVLVDIFSDVAAQFAAAVMSYGG
ncbi:MAG: response regulator [Oscillospiraceae bacterium]|jgi:putative two-component system response regulator|nr:response regulator [Oscillospiraceae bacterium]